MNIFSPTIKDDVTITGSSNANLLRISSPSNTDILFISGSGKVGIGTSPSEWIHLYSDPSDGKYIRIDGDQISPSPVLNEGFATYGYGLIDNQNYLAEPNYWMEIKLGAAGGGTVLIPCYLPDVP